MTAERFQHSDRKLKTSENRKSTIVRPYITYKNFVSQLDSYKNFIMPQFHRNDTWRQV